MTRTQLCRLAVLLGSVSTGALAQSVQPGTQPHQEVGTPPGDHLEEIIVTAQKRNEKLQDVPIAITAFNAAALKKMGFTNMADLIERVPALAITPYPNSGSSLVVFMRGVGEVDAIQPARDPGVGIYLDDVYIARGEALTSDLGDIERVEVLRGPQGTLYGRNTIGGAVKFITAKPTGEFGVKESFDAGNFGYVRNLINVNLPEFAKISAKLTYMNSNFDGWVRNPGTGGDFGSKTQEGYRIALRWRPLDDITVDYTYDNARQGGVSFYEQHAYSSLEIGFSFPLQPGRADQSYRPVNLPIEDSFVSSGHALTAAWDLSEAVSVKSITSYRDLKANALHDTTEAFNLPVALFTGIDQHQFSQEGLVTGSLDALNVKYTVGGFYFTETGGLRSAGLANPFSPKFFGVPYSPPTLADFGPDVLSGATNESAGAYGNLTWTPPILDDRLSVILGGRYSSDDRAASNAVQSARTSYSSFDPSVTIDFKWTDKLHTYAKYAKGYRSGGFNLDNTALSPFGPEQLRSYEVGLKSMWWHDRLQVNIDGYTQDYKAIQLDFVDPIQAGGAGGGIATVNAGQATFRGVEGDFEFIPVDGLTLTANFSYLDAAREGGTTVANPFGGPPLAGLSLPNAPRWKYDLGMEYAFPPFAFGSLSALVGYSYRGSETSNGGPGTAGDVRPGYGLVNARITLSDIAFARGSLAVSMWANNLTDENYQYYHNFGAIIFGEPRSFGANLTYRY